VQDRMRTRAVDLAELLKRDTTYIWAPRTMTILSLARPPLRRDDYFHC